MKTETKIVYLSELCKIYEEAKLQEERREAKERISRVCDSIERDLGIDAEGTADNH